MTTFFDLTPAELCAVEAVLFGTLDELDERQPAVAVAGLVLLTGRGVVTRDEGGEPIVAPELADLVRRVSGTPALVVTRNDGERPVEFIHLHVSASGATTLQTLPTGAIRLTEYGTDGIDGLLTEIIGAATEGVGYDTAGDVLVAAAALSEDGAAVEIQWPDPIQDPVALTLAAPWRESAVTWVTSAGHAWLLAADLAPSEITLTPASRGALSEAVTAIVADIFDPV